MRITRHYQFPNVKKEPCVATIGNFDGLHLGHRQILKHLREKADELSMPLTVISFEPLPAEFFSSKAPPRIYPLRDKIRLLNELGVDHFVCLRFDAKLANMSPQDFVNKLLLDFLNVKYLAVGDDFKFGHKRTGDFSLLKEMGDANSMQVVDTPTIQSENERVSSSRIRKSLQNADLDASNRLLVNNYQLSGRVRHGDKRGRTIGFPTINMKIPENLAPKKGVYAVRINGLVDKQLGGVANLGSRPTVNGFENRLETHIFDFDKDVYGKAVCVELHEFLRAEKKFESFDELKEQIILDVASARQFLN